MKKPSIASYFDQELLKREQDQLFTRGLRYVAHSLMVPNTNDYISLAGLNHRYVLFNYGNNDYGLISNVCLHRQARLVEGRGNAKNISCKLHCWTYSNRGDLKSKPHFKDEFNEKLKTKQLNNWNGLLFDSAKPSLDLKACGIDQYIDFSKYLYAGSESQEYNFNWKTFSEIYLENYHVYSMHPGLKKFVSAQDLEWHFGSDFSVQKVGLSQNFDQAGSDIYKKWHEMVKSEHFELPRYGAIWIYIYPNIMLEWYPNTLVISTIYPLAPQRCINHVEFFYPSELYHRNPEYFDSEKKAYMETATEDEEACVLLDQGRKSLYLSGEEENGPVESFLEAGVGHFYQHLDQQLNC